MNTEKIVKEARLIMYATLLVGIALLSAGLIFTWIDARIVSNNRALIGLSFIPLSVSLMYYLKLTKIQNDPQKMKAIIISENDERLQALKNEADANAHRLVQSAIFLAYMGYTLMVPADIFESIGWWMLLLLLLLAFISPAVFRSIAALRELDKPR